MRLLIVDDESIIRKGLLELPWVTVGIQEVVEADSGDAALRILDSMTVQAILCDIQMPGMDGLGFISAVRTQHRDLPIILLSGYSLFAYAQQAIRYGVSEYLLKPSSPEEIMACVSRAISVQCGQPYELQIFPFLHTKCHNELASRILNYLERHYMEDTTLDALAAVMNYTPQYLSRLIKRELGCNFVTLISMIRMAKAAECLARTEEKVYLLCARVGIPDQRYFSQKFKSVFGETPLQFRQNHAGMPTAQFQQQIWEKVNRWMGKDEEIVSLH